MATVPLNHFNRVSTTLGTTLTQVYSAPASTAAIMLTILAANDTNSPQTITVGISGNGGPNVATVPYYNLVKSFTIAPNDVTNLIVGKVVLMNYDAIYASCTNPNSVDLTLSILEALNTTTTT